MRTRSLTPSLGLVAFSLAASALLADGTASVSAELKGTVAPAGAGATLRLRGQEDGSVRTTRTGPRGAFRFLAVRPGVYTLTVEAQGFATQELKGVVLQVGTAASLRIRLDAQASGTVAVTAQPTLSDPQRTQLAQIVDGEQLAALPIQRRNFADLSLTTPGVVQQNTPLDFGAPASNLSVNGMNPRQNNFMVDGLDNNDLGNGNLRSMVSQEAVQEFQVLTGGYGAEFGRATGGLVNTLTRSGGNTFAGSAFCFYSPGTLAADSPQGDTAPAFKLTQFGATASGPLVKDRLFLFACVERLDRHDSSTVTIDPTVVTALQGAGLPVQDGVFPYAETLTTALVKLDWLQNPDSRWTFRLIQGRDDNGAQIPFGGLVAASNGAAGSSRDLSLGLSNQWVGSTWCNELRLLHAVRNNDLTPMDPTGGVEVILLGQGTVGTQRLAQQSTRAVYDQVADTLLVTAGPHTFKAGFDVLATQDQGTVAQNVAGLYQFEAIPQVGLTSSLAAFLAPSPVGGTGLPVAFVQSFGDPATRFRTGSLALFVQDDWALGDRVLLKAGLRYDREDLPRFQDTPAYQALANPSGPADPTLGPVLLPNGPYPFAQLLTPNLDWSSARLAPRLALSWQASPTLRFHGGWGIYYGTTNLGPLMGTRVYNGQAMQTLYQTVLDQPPYAPWLSWAQPGHRYGALPPGNQTVVLPGDVSMPENRQGVAGFEWTPTPTQVLSLEFVTAQGRHFLNTRDVNAFVPYVADGTAVLRRPDLAFGSIQRVDASGLSTYTGETLQWRWRPGPRFTLDCHYTHSRARDNYIDWNPDVTPQNTFDPSQEWGPSYQDQTHRALATAVWRTPAEAGPLARDWTVAAIARWESGRPYTILAGYDLNMNGDGTSDRPAGVGRNSATTPSVHNLDLRLGRDFHPGPVRLELMVDCFNLFNTTQVQAVQNDQLTTTPPYGAPVATFPKRQVQFGVRASF